MHNMVFLKCGFIYAFYYRPIKYLFHFDYVIQSCPPLHITYCHPGTNNNFG